MLKTEGFGAVLEVEMLKKCTALRVVKWLKTRGLKHTVWLEAHIEVKMYKTPQDRTTFGS